MSQCEALVRNASSGVAASLRAVDCVSAETTASAFARLFGTHGALLPALTLLLTIYIATFAVLLLTGRARLGMGALTPRMLTLGLVLTFTTSWVAYQGVVWNLTIGAPDQIASVLMGAQGSATQIFADRIDILFNAIAETAAAAPRGATGGSFTPGNLMWLSALLLMLGTVGVLVTARIALAVLLGLGPVFIVMALFGPTRGLFAGWLRGVVLTALTPLFALLGGAFMVELAVPVVAALRGAETIDGRAAMALFVIAAVHCALMAMAIRVVSAMVAGWRVFGLAGGGEKAAASVATGPAPATAAHSAPSPGAAVVEPRVRAMVASLSVGGFAPAAANANGMGAAAGARTIIMPAAATAAGAGPSRTRGIGSRFSRPAVTPRKSLT